MASHGKTRKATGWNPSWDQEFDLLGPWNLNVTVIEIAIQRGEESGRVTMLNMELLDANREFIQWKVNPSSMRKTQSYPSMQTNPLLISNQQAIPGENFCASWSPIVETPHHHTQPRPDKTLLSDKKWWLRIFVGRGCFRPCQSPSIRGFIQVTRLSSKKCAIISPIIRVWPHFSLVCPVLCQPGERSSN